MKEITFPLSPKERSTIYFQLGKLGAFCSGENYMPSLNRLPIFDILSFACEESRFDPRLLGVLIDYFAKHYPQINPFELAQSINTIPTPQTLGVVLEFSMKVNRDPELKSFAQIVLGKIQMAPFQSYFSHQYRPRVGNLIEQEIHTPWEFRKWGFIAHKEPYLKEFRPNKSPLTYPKEDRIRILRNLFKKKKNIQIKDYLCQLQGAITRQQAYQDLRNLKGIRHSGKNKGRIYHHRSEIKSE